MELVNIKFKLNDGSIVEVGAELGASLLTVAHKNSIPLEGACEGSLACSTCHVILEEGLYKVLDNNNPPNDDEEDMLDLAFCLTSTSRLGCQIIVTKDMEGATISLPAATRNYLD